MKECKMKKSQHERVEVVKSATWKSATWKEWHIGKVEHGKGAMYREHKKIQYSINTTWKYWNMKKVQH